MSTTGSLARSTLVASPQAQRCRQARHGPFPVILVTDSWEPIDSLHSCRSALYTCTQEDAPFGVSISDHGMSSVCRRIYLANTMQISWGVVLCCHAAVNNAVGLYVVRAFLGLCEAGMWPAAILQLCYWYRPDEMAPRVVLVTLLGNFATIISGILAFAFNGVYARGLSGWKW